MFTLDHESKKTHARAGRLRTAHGVVQTPVFMPIATRGAVKHLSCDDLRSLGAEIILGNTYHLLLQPGPEILRSFGGLHGLMGWDRAILTDSGGYQVFSLGERRDASKNGAGKPSLVKITDDGATFRSVLDGSLQTLTPERVVDLQYAIGSDLLMPLDECIGYPHTKLRARDAMERTHAWAKRSVAHMEEMRRAYPTDEHALFAIVQGGSFSDLREESARTLATLPFDGYAIGGLAVGEPRAVMGEMIRAVTPFLPTDRPRYLMGVGEPEELVRAVQSGIDMFDCVIPTRNARHGTIYMWKKDWRAAMLKGKDFYDRIHISNARFRTDETPLDPLCSCMTCRTASRGYLAHLFRTSESLGLRLASLHNLAFYLSLMRRLRALVIEGDL